jgi:hypothetical protein
VFGKFLRKLLHEIDVCVSTDGCFFVYSVSVFDFFRVKACVSVRVTNIVSE